MSALGFFALKAQVKISFYCNTINLDADSIVSWQYSTKMKALESIVQFVMK